MRRQGQYMNAGADAYVAAQMQHGQQMDHNSGQYQGELEAFTPERDNTYVTPRADGHRGWERDGSEPSSALASHVLYEGQSGDASRSYYHGQKPDLRLTLEKQGNNDMRPQTHKKDVDHGYEKDPFSQTFEGLEQKFLDDIMKLAKELNDAEDAENVRHREKINSINSQYQEQLSVLRTRHASHRDEFLRRESSARQQQYQQALMAKYSNSSMGPRDTQGFGGIPSSATVGEAYRPYDNDQYDSFEDRPRFYGSVRDRLEPKGPYSGGRAYNTSSRFY
ncbi:hypothetical protein EUGRSUZ_J00585 [Eucalyptus grandis]|uniref:Uncharacterized protein n=6 Tax=Eucalyptus grandis TaxID=71139 RepID=A0A059AC64_EUCGR|nr:hypothetical protein EUGRSUZ_J00585 [Eucalyptus grandis]KAK3408313.1 hypothetical protein EUGRSUZ_J00585 [Eucalyptus grandis]KAK3408315.1 hypothetical protein EUGRSUZ_J00585 [Eucalyptus grandis]